MTLIACSRCGKIHKRGECKLKKSYVKKRNLTHARFRSSTEWQNKREEILRRDNHLCRVCLDEGFINPCQQLDIHHIECLKDNFEKRLDNGNLISLCKIHHYRADRGLISAEYLKKLISPEGINDEKSD